MMELLWLLLPVAAASGWWAAKREPVREREPPPGGTEYFQGLNYLLNDKPDKAIEVLSRLAEVDRDTAETQMTLGSLFRRRGEVDRAIRIHSNLIAKMALTHQQRNHAVLELGEDYLRAGLFDRAESLFRELVQQTDYTVVALERLVAIYEREKDWQQAIVYCERLEHMTGRSLKEQIANYYCELAEVARNKRAEAQVFLAQALGQRFGDLTDYLGLTNRSRGNHLQSEQPGGLEHRHGFVAGLLGSHQGFHHCQIERYLHEVEMIFT